MLRPWEELILSIASNHGARCLLFHVMKLLRADVCLDGYALRIKLMAYLTSLFVTVAILRNARRRRAVQLTTLEMKI